MKDTRTCINQRVTTRRITAWLVLMTRCNQWTMPGGVLCNWMVHKCAGAVSCLAARLSTGLLNLVHCLHGSALVPVLLAVAIYGQAPVFQGR